MAHVATVVLVLALVAAAQASQLPAAAVDHGASREAELTAGGKVRLKHSPLTGLTVSLTRTPGAQADLVPVAGADPRAAAAIFLDRFGTLFGVAGSAGVRTAQVAADDEVGMSHVRLQQYHKGLPVAAGELYMHFRSGDVVAVNARTSPIPEGLSLQATLPAGEARRLAQSFLHKRSAASSAVVSPPRLEVLDRGLLDGARWPTRLAWFMEVRDATRREFLWVDAHTGAVLLNFNQRPTMLERAVYSADHTSSVPGRLVRGEGEPPTGDRDADAAYDLAGDVHAYFLLEHARDSYDGRGGILTSTVHYCEPLFPVGCGCPCNNAFWDGQRVIFGDGLPRADDVVAHEFTHGVIEDTARLFYYMQSGALSESYADIFGETVDQLNGKGTDSTSARWFIGEDLPTTGAVRYMMEPTLFGDPAKVSDPRLVCEDPGEDNGGVHSNSAVPAHAFALMVDGGTYNGFRVEGLGLRKAAQIHYRALTRYLLSAADFGDHAEALRESCADLAGTDEIIEGDCVQVRAALDAVEMSKPWPCRTGDGEDPSPCPAGFEVTTLWSDDFEDDPLNWEPRTMVGQERWVVEDVFAASGRRHLHAETGDGVSDSAMEMAVDVPIPASSRLRFSHAFGFENDSSADYDGGVVEYSIDGGRTWADAGNLMIHKGARYSGTVSACCGNPLAGRAAFVGDSFGYTVTQLDLGVLAGTDIRLRFRLGTDEALGDYGWFIDDVRIYRCIAVTGSRTPTATRTATPSPSDTLPAPATAGRTPTPAQHASTTPTFTATESPTCTATAASTVTSTERETPNPTATDRATPTVTFGGTVARSPTPGASPTPCPGATSTSTFTVALTPTLSRSNTATETRSPIPAPPPCPGDCDNNGLVSVEELVRAVRIALGDAAAAGCPVADVDSDGHVRIDELVTAVRHALAGCGA